jgi:hypothetical protein
VIASKLLQCETITNTGVGLVDPTVLSFADLTFPFGVALDSAWQPLRHTDANVSTAPACDTTPDPRRSTTSDG